MRDEAFNENIYVPVGARTLPETRQEMSHADAPNYRGSRTDAYNTPLTELRQIQDLMGLIQGTGSFSPTALYAVRRAAANSPHVRGWLNLAKSQVVGREGVLPLFSGIADESHRRAVQSLWEEFAEEPVMSADRDLVSALEGTVQSLVTDGRVFWLVRYSDAYPQGIAIHPLPRELFMEFAENEAEGVARGVRYDGAGRITGYLFNKDYNDVVKMNRLFGTRINGVTSNQFASGNEAIVIPAANLLVVQQPERHDTYNPDTSPILPLLQMDARVRLIDEASFESADAAGRINLIIERAKEAFGNKEAEDAFMRAIPKQLEKNGVLFLPKGHAAKTHSPQYPNTNIEAMQVRHMKAAASAAGVDFPSYSNNAGEANFASLRVFNARTRDNWQRMQDALVKKMVRPLFRLWVAFQTLPTRPLSRVLGVRGRAVARNVKFRTRCFDWHDPAKEAAAQSVALSNRVASPQEVMRQRGRDPVEVEAEWMEAIQQAGRLLGVDVNKPEGRQAAIDFWSVKASVVVQSGGETDRQPEPANSGENR